MTSAPECWLEVSGDRDQHTPDKNADHVDTEELAVVHASDSCDGRNKNSAPRHEAGNDDGSSPEVTVKLR